ncbi:MAG: glycosyltransferase family 4 protein [Alphaproteobacteria bacterium]
MRVAFYAPMKPPDHRVPSGDRRMARALISALAAGGHDVRVASRLRAFEGRGDRSRQRRIEARGSAEVERLGALYGARRAWRPDVWFTYHLYHKAPDWIGPTVARRLGIPYVIAEASHAAKQADGPWSRGFQAAREAIAGADAVLAMTALDRAGLARIVPRRRLIPLPPFLDPAPFGAARGGRGRIARRHGLDPAQPWLLAVAMMRPGAKLESYRRLGAALARVMDRPWRLVVVGDGTAAVDCRAALERLGPRHVAFLGALPPAVLPAYYAAADIFVWPGIGEAYGMAYLEAQAAGCPVIAGDEPGVRAVVRDGRSGLLVAAQDDAAFAGAVRRLLDEPALRTSLGARARAWVAGRHGPARAARALERAFRIAGLAP